MHPRSGITGRQFDLVVGSVGCLLGTGVLLGELVAVDDIDFVVLLSVPAIMVMAWFPIFINPRRITGGVEVTLDVCALIFLAAMVEPSAALATWFVGVALGQVCTRKQALHKWFNTGLAVVAGAVALTVIDWLRQDLAPRPGQLLPVAMGAAAYFVVNLVPSTTSVALAERTSIRRELAPQRWAGALAAVMATSSLGYLAALVVRGLPSWATWLLVFPITTICFASWVQSRSSEQARRLTVLLRTATRVQSISDRATLLEVLRTGARELLHEPRVSLRATPPGDGEFGVPIHGGNDQLWIVVPTLSRATSSPRDDEHGLEALVAVAEDALTTLGLSEQMAHLAWHDPLTGLVNRSLFMDRVEHALEVQGSRGTLLAVLVCDLDGFKRINDLLGHEAGDELLTHVGLRIKASVRQVDTVARLGGDEFAVLLEEVANLAEVTEVCERVLESMRQKVALVPEDVSVTTSIGVAMSTTGSSSDMLVSQADLAMYHAKRRGKNRWETYDTSFGDERRQRIELVDKLRRAVETQELEVFYQPILDMPTNDVVALEALVRWRRDGVLVSPDVFMRTAQEGSLVFGLGDIVLDAVAADAPHLLAAAGHSMTLSVNVSGQDLQNASFTSRVAATRESLGAARLVLEVTEQDIVGYDAELLQAMSSLTGADVRFAIDDFGVGFSSVGFLQRLPVSFVKVDPSFISDLENDVRARSLIGSLTLMGDALDLDVVVMGVERASQTHHLRDAGVTLAQGPLFGAPTSYADTLTLLSSTPRPSVVAGNER